MWLNSKDRRIHFSLHIFNHTPSTWPGRSKEQIQLGLLNGVTPVWWSRGNQSSYMIVQGSKDKDSSKQGRSWCFVTQPRISPNIIFSVPYWLKQSQAQPNSSGRDKKFHFLMEGVSQNLQPSLNYLSYLPHKIPPSTER